MEPLKGLIKRLFPPRAENMVPSNCKSRREWSIGIYIGPSPFDFRAPQGNHNPVVTRNNFPQVQAEFVADPFMVKSAGSWYMFFEVMNGRTGKGEIGYAISHDGLNWTDMEIVLAEPFHLSYPYVFELGNNHYMIPETHRSNSVRLYQGVDFPRKWSLASVLIEGRDFADPSLFYANNRWWMFTGHGGAPYYGDTLRLYHADQLTGPWFEHPKSPLIQGNPRKARPGGRVLVLGDRIIRYAQDCYPVYGIQLRAFEILDLTLTNYHEREIQHKSPVLAASGACWNAAGMHHIDPHVLEDGSWIACVDGFFWQTSRVESNGAHSTPSNEISHQSHSE